MRFRWFLLSVLLGPFAAPVVPAKAETVFVSAAFAEKANGWLFGSRKDRSCWIAFPWHLVDRNGGEAGVRFLDQSGRAGETGRPTHALRIAGLENSRGLEDLAFAPVTTGRRGGECLSRLGLPSSLAFVEALRSDAPLQLTFMQEGAFRRVEVQQTLAVSDAARGSVLLLRPRSPQDLGVLQKGISGSVAELRWSGRLRPAAMVLGEAGSGVKTMRALRFDRIRAAFEQLEAEQAADSGAPPGAEDASGPVGLAYRIVSLLADVQAGSAPLAGGGGVPGCWQARPSAGRRVVELVLEVAEPGQRIASLELAAAAGCGAPAMAIVEGRKPGQLWELLSTACPAGPQPRACRINRTAPYEIRVKLRPQGGVVGLSHIALR